VGGDIGRILLFEGLDSLLEPVNDSSLNMGRIGQVKVETERVYLGRRKTR
jgi:hypothetical protein